MGWHLGLHELGGSQNVCVCVPGDEKGLWDIADPLGPWGAGRAAAETE